MRWRLKWSPRSTRPPAEWWTAYSLDHTASDLQRMVAKEDVAIVLLENVEAIEESGVWENGKRVVRVRLTLPPDKVDRYMVDLCLTEIGLGLLDPVQL